MHYFTPGLFVRLQDLKDEGAVIEWDRAVERYAARLREIGPRLPRPLRRAAQGFKLHDADVLSMSRRGDTLCVTLQLDPPAEFLLALTYSLVEEPRVNRSALPPEYRTPQPAWLYDEVGIAEPRPAPPRRRAGGRRGAKAPPVYSHDVLLSNGWEVGLRFSRVRLSQPMALLPTE
jgi:hypothetical protein